ncbi:MAG: hypothetical protein IPM58_16225 [Nitrospira sp.]|nr:hypothetical protein [Nitrospira sp.]
MGKEVAVLFQVDLGCECGDVELLRTAIARCTEVEDFTTHQLLEHMIQDSEEHVDGFETRLRTIAQAGLERFLSEQIQK